jgi:transposase
MMQLHLDEISRNVAPGAHAVLLLDRAGWHTTSKLDAPDNITPIFLPSRAPELNPVENVWQYLRQNWLSNTVFEPTTQSSTPHAELGETSSLNPKRSQPSECETGLTSVTRYDLWYKPRDRDPG